MKKLFTIFSLASTMAMTASAVNPAALLEYKVEGMKQLTVEQTAKMRTMNADLINALQGNSLGAGVVTRSYNDGTNVYHMALANSSTPVTDMWKITDKDGNQVGFEEMPFYVAQIVVERRNANNESTAYLCYIVPWPTYDSWYADTAHEGQFDIVPMGEFMNGSKNNLPCSFQQIDEGGYVFTQENGVMTYGIMSNVYSDGIAKGQSITTGASPVTGSFQTATSASNTTIIKFNSYDDDEKTVDFTTRAYIKNAESGRTANVTINYAGGTFHQSGFIIENYKYDFGEAHIYNAGTFNSEEITWRDDPFEFEWSGNFHKYFFIATNKYLMAANEEGKGRFNAESVEFFWRPDSSEADRQTENLSVIQGFIFTPADCNMESPNHNFSWASIDKRENPTPDVPGSQEEVYMIPQDYKIIPGNVYDTAGNEYGWSKELGSLIIMQGYTGVIDPARSNKLLIGSTQGFYVSFYDVYKNWYEGEYRGNIIYHYDYEDMDKYKAIPAVGTYDAVDAVVADADAQISVANGAVTVVSAKAISAEVYSLAGQRVAAANVNGTVVLPLEKGVYVVKAGNVAKKVVL